MKFSKLLIRTLIFVGLIITVDQVVGYILDKKYQSNTCYYANGEINDFIQNKNCDTLIVGSSRVLHMIDPAILGPKCLNIAKQQKHNYYHSSIIDILNNENKLPSKLLIINIEVEDLFMEKEHLLIEQMNSLRFYYSKNNIVTKFINKKGWHEQLKLISRIYRHNPNGLKLITNPIEKVCPEYPNSGFIPLHPTVNDSARLAQSLIDDFKPIKNQRINNTIFENILHIKSLCDQKGIKLLIIDAPYYKVHPSFKKASNAIKNFCDQKSIEFIDFKYEKIDGLDDKNNWYDNMHANEKGSQIYTRYLKSKICVSQ